MTDEAILLCDPLWSHLDAVVKRLETKPIQTLFSYIPDCEAKGLAAATINHLAVEAGLSANPVFDPDPPNNRVRIFHPGGAVIEIDTKATISRQGPTEYEKNIAVGYLAAWRERRAEQLQAAEAATPADGKTPAGVSDEDTTDPQGVLAALGVENTEANRKRLDRWRGANPGLQNNGWHEVADARGRQPRYRYRVGSVRHLFGK